jgi:hypothetical protein
MNATPKKPNSGKKKAQLKDLKAKDAGKVRGGGGGAGSNSFDIKANKKF